MERDSGTAGGASEGQGGKAAAGVPGARGTDPAGDLTSLRVWVFDQLEDMARSLVAARAETASLSRDFSFWWGWADKEAAPVIRYMRGHHAAVPPRMAEWAGQAQEQAEIVEALAERVDTLSLRMEEAEALITMGQSSRADLAEEVELFMTGMAERLDALALVVNNRLDLLESEVGQLQAAGEEMRRFMILVAEKAGWRFLHGTPVLPADGDNGGA